MKRIPLLLLFLFALPLAAQETAGSSPALVLQHVTVIDTASAKALPDRTVVISGKRIAAVGSSSEIATPNNARVINGSGKFLIPGLWDMHVHPHGKDSLPLFIANGVTGIRSMWGSVEQVEWRKEIEMGALTGPRMVIGSPVVDGPRPFWPASVSVSNEAEARAAVDRAKQYGAAFVKVYSFLPREEYFAIVDEAKKQGIEFAGHIPIVVTAQEASNAGQKSVEHLTGILPACSAISDKMNEAAKADLQEYLAGGKRMFEGPREHELREHMIDSYNPEKAAALFALFKKNGTWQVPTLMLWRMFSSLNDTAFTGDPRLKYVPVRERESWDPAQAAKESAVENTALSEKDFGADLRVVGAMQKAGVGILAGTDTGNPFCVPGFALHDELRLLVRAGLTPGEVLQAATLNPARFMGREGDFGTVGAGKMADLVVLDANPLDDVGNTEKIAAVIFDGRLLGRTELDGMLAKVDALANRKPIGEVMAQTIQDKGVAAAVAQFHELQKTQPEAYDFSEGELVGLGYELLHAKKASDAIEVFKLSTEVYPKSYNTYDSLGEAYMDHGDKELAIENYKKSLELNPGNENGKEMLKKLGVE